MKHFALVIAFFPVLAFCLAAIAELRAPSNRADRLRRLAPVLLGMAVFVVSLDPQRLLHVTATSSLTLSRIMTMFSAAIACSGVFISYSRRSSAVWVACGGLVMTLFWIFNRVVV